MRTFKYVICAMFVGYGGLALWLILWAVSDCRSVQRCERLGGHVVNAQHGGGWSCVGAQPESP